MDSVIIKKIMAEFNLTQQQFAEEIGLPPSVVCEINKGKMAFTRDHIDRICQRFDVNPVAFFLQTSGASIWM